MNYTSAWKQDPRIQEPEEDGSLRDRGGALQGSGCVGQRCVGKIKCT